MLVKRTSPFDYLDQFFEFDEHDHQRKFFPKVDVVEKKEQVEISLDIPGVDKEDMEVKVENNYLIIKGDRKDQRVQKEEEKVIFNEVYYGSFERSWKIDDSFVDINKIEATIKNGVFKVVLPKIEKVSKNIKIKVKE